MSSAVEDEHKVIPHSFELLPRAPTIRDVIMGGSGIAGMYGAVSEADAIAALTKAFQLGIRRYDTAPWYGAGWSEQLFGTAFATFSEEQRRDIRVYTKAGRVCVPIASARRDDAAVEWENLKEFFLDGRKQTHVPREAYDGDGVRRSFHDSSQRLSPVSIFCLRLHDAETESRLADATKPNGGIAEMIRLRRSGAVQQISLGMNSSEYMRAILERYPAGTFDCVMLAGCWNLFDCSGLEILQLCSKKGIRVHLAGVFCTGLLWDLPKFKYQTPSKEVLDKLDRWKALASKYSFSLPQLGVAFCFLPSCVEYLCLGAKFESEVDTFSTLCNGRLVPVALWQEAQTLGLLPKHLQFPQAKL